MVKRQRTRPASLAEAKQLRSKAEQYRQAMSLSYEKGLLDAAVSNAVHAVMLMANAVTARMAGQYFSGHDHNLAADYLEETVGTDAVQAAGLMRRVINLKGLVEYEARYCTAKEAADVVKRQRTERFFTWAERKLP